MMSEEDDPFVNHPPSPPLFTSYSEESLFTASPLLSLNGIQIQEDVPNPPFSSSCAIHGAEDVAVSPLFAPTFSTDGNLSDPIPPSMGALGAADDDASPSSSGTVFVPSSPFEGLSLASSGDEGLNSRKSVLEILTLPTLERRSSAIGLNLPPIQRRSSGETSGTKSDVHLPTPVPVPAESPSFPQTPRLERPPSILDLVSFFPSIEQPLGLEEFPSTPSPSSAHTKSIIDGIPAPRKTSLEHTLPSERKSSLFAFDRFYSIDEDDGRAAQPRQTTGEANRMHKTRLVTGARRELHLLSTAQLVAITCFAVAGGPFGFEDTILAGGAALTLLGLLIFPVFWSAPIALMTAELSCMIPESGGHVLWVYRAFGPFWSFINSFFAFTCSVLENALYPALFVEYLGALLYDNAHPVSYGWAVALKISVVAVAAIINIRGVDIVGTWAIVLGIGVLAPFGIMCMLGIFHLNFAWTYSENIPASINWGKFITVLLWNASGFDAAGTCAAEVRTPAQSYPQALSVSVALILGVYGLPTLIGASVVPNYKLWEKGTYIIAAKKIGGQFLNALIGISAALSALGLLLTRLCTNSRIVYGMALVEQLPPMFTKVHPKYATPWTAITLTSVITLFLSGFSSYSLSEADMLFYALSTILKFAALIQLRFTEPDAFRAFKIPLETWPMTALATIPIGFCVTMIFVSSERAHGLALIWSTAAILAYIAKEWAAQQGIHADEAVALRMRRVQENIDRMQKRIDHIIDKEVKHSMETLETLGHALHIHGSSSSSGGGGGGSQSSNSVRSSNKVAFDENIEIPDPRI